MPERLFVVEGLEPRSSKTTRETTFELGRTPGCITTMRDCWTGSDNLLSPLATWDHVLRSFAVALARPERSNADYSQQIPAYHLARPVVA